MISPGEAWQELGIDPTRDAVQIRRAYARRLRDANPEDNSPAFLTLRAAYELAMQLARRGLADPAPPLPPPPAPAPEPAPVVSPQAQQLARAGQRLGELLRVRGPLDIAEARRLLDEILASPLLESLNVQIALERRLAEMLLAAAPRADELIQVVSDRFGWPARVQGIRTDPLVVAAVGRLESRRELDQFSAASGRRGLAFRLVHERPRPVWRGALIAFYGIDFTVRTLLREMDWASPLLRRMLNRESLVWFTAYGQRWMAMVTVVRILAVPTLVLPLLPVGRLGSRVLLALLIDTAVIVGFSAILAARKWAIAPAQAWFRERNRRRPSALLQLGWYPLVIALWFLSLVLPMRAVAFIPLVVLGLLCMGWAVTVRGSSLALSARARFTRLFWTVALNVPLVVCGYLFAGTSDGAFLPLTWLALVALVVSYEAGSLVLSSWYETRVPARGKWAVSIALAAAALLLGGASLRPPAGMIPPGLGALSILLIVLQRTPALNFTTQVQSLRFRLGWIMSWLVIQLHSVLFSFASVAPSPALSAVLWVTLAVVGTQVFWWYQTLAQQRQA